MQGIDEEAESENVYEQIERYERQNLMDNIYCPSSFSSA
jgi:hypothetical protein